MHIVDQASRKEGDDCALAEALNISKQYLAGVKQSALAGLHQGTGGGHLAMF
jgi:hypothetical protein